MVTMNNPQPPSVSARTRFYLYLACLSLVAVGLGFAATARYGPGLASDSVIYLSVAQNLLAGKGLTMFLGTPLLSWPPLFSIVLAGLSALTRQDVFVVGWVLNVLLSGVNVFLSGFVFWRAFQARPVYAWLASAFVCLSLSSLRVHATTFTEPLYITMTLGFLIGLEVYGRTRARSAFVGLVVLSALAPMLRYVGLAFPAVAGLVVVIVNWRDLRAMLRDGLVLGGVASLPIGWWLILRNVLTYGSLFGTSGQTVDVWQNTSLGLTKIMHWFVPYLDPLMPVLTRPLIVLPLLAVLLVGINLRQRTALQAWWGQMRSPWVYPAMLYGLVYFLAVAVTSVTSDHRWLNDDDRYYVILLVPVLLLLFITFEELVRPHLPFAPRTVTLALVAGSLLWSLYPLYGLREYLVEARQVGEPSTYNLFNTRTYHEMPVMQELQSLWASEPAATVYTNYAELAWFFNRKPAQPLPVRDFPDYQAVYSAWPAVPGYLVWFKPNEYKRFLSPEELAPHVTLQLIYSDESGDIYKVQAR